VRKVYGADQIRYLRCRRCGCEFSERKGTALWNTKVSEAKAVAVAEHLSEGCSQASTARLVKVDLSVVQRLNRTVGRHGQRFHTTHVQDVQVAALQADERHGFSATKQATLWEAEIMDPQSKLVLSHVQGRRDEGLIRRLYADARQRVAQAQGKDISDLVLLKLLPYFNTAPNQAKGAWIHFAPTVTGDIRKWYQSKKWVKAVDWPAATQTILNFVKRCNDNPHGLAQACQDFAATPNIKGFQAGTLTPILNALRLQHFAIINSKSQELINYLKAVQVDGHMAWASPIYITGTA
jgi:hypothetical protein